MLKDILNKKIYCEILRVGLVNTVEEVRIRTNSPLLLEANGKRYSLCVVNREDVEYTLNVITRGSMYVINDYIKQGYVTYSGGIRVGLCGEVVYSGREILTIKEINSVVIRVPHNKYGVAEDLVNIIRDDCGRYKNVLICSPPYSGKTTMLRELARKTSIDGQNVVIVDEKNEISATSQGDNYLDVGISSVIVGAKRKDGIEMAVRNLSPDILVTDEIYGEEDYKSIERCIKSGVTVFTSKHSYNVCEYDLELFDYIVELSRQPVGKIVRIQEGYK